MTQNIEILKKIHDGCKASLEIHAEPDKTLLPWESKFGGKPYFTQTMKYPHSNDGRPLSFLAQINFSEFKDSSFVTRHMGFFPKEGLLQFYIIDNGTIKKDFDIVQFLEEHYANPTNEMLFGPDSKNPIKQNLFRVIYIPVINPDAPLQEIPNICMSDDFPAKEEYHLSFEPGTRSITPNIYEYYDHFKEILNNEKIRSEFNKLYGGLFFENTCNHRMGGYPDFAQGDPRHQYDYHKDKNIVLLQIGSIGSIQWTGSGIASFLISEEKLKNLDFSEVMYNMDFS